MTATRIVLSLVAGLTASGAFAASPTKITVTNLSCGQARLQARTTSLAHPKPEDPFLWLAQKITFRNAATGAEHAIPVEGSTPSGSSSGMQSIVSSWKCLHGAQGNVILLWYACERPDSGGVCQGEREWEVLLDSAGRRLDAGYAHQDPRYGDLMKRLGITIDVELESATGD